MNESIESEDDIQEKGLRRYIDDNNYSAEEIREAYYNFCGIEDETKQDKRIEDLVTEMQKLSDARFPINRFVKIIKLKERWDDSPIQFELFVNSLPISDNEKAILNSIVQKNRTGEIEIHAGGQVITKVLINSNTSTEGVAIALQEKLESIIEEIGKENLIAQRVSFRLKKIRLVNILHYLHYSKYISNKYFESCLMLFAKDPGMRESKQYCSYCYANGGLTYEGTDLKEFQKMSHENMVWNGMNRFLAGFYT